MIAVCCITLSDLTSSAAKAAYVYQIYCRNTLSTERLFCLSSSYWLTEKARVIHQTGWHWPECSSVLSFPAHRPRRGSSDKVLGPTAQWSVCARVAWGECSFVLAHETINLTCAVRTDGGGAQVKYEIVAIKFITLTAALVPVISTNWKLEQKEFLIHTHTSYFCSKCWFRAEYVLKFVSQKLFCTCLMLTDVAPLR